MIAEPHGKAGTLFTGNAAQLAEALAQVFINLYGQGSPLSLDLIGKMEREMLTWAAEEEADLIPVRRPLSSPSGEPLALWRAHAEAGNLRALVLSSPAGGTVAGHLEDVVGALSFALPRQMHDICPGLAERRALTREVGRWLREHRIRRQGRRT